jgi:hypothetical protein
MATNVIDLFKSEAAGVLDERDVLLTRKEAAVYLRKSVPTLERWAREGIGPKPVKINRWAHYRLVDLRDAAKGAST